MFDNWSTVFYFVYIYIPPRRLSEDKRRESHLVGVISEEDNGGNDDNDGPEEGGVGHQAVEHHIHLRGHGEGSKEEGVDKHEQEPHKDTAPGGDVVQSGPVWSLKRDLKPLKIQKKNQVNERNKSKLW